MLFESPVPCTNRPWHRLDQGRLWSSNLLPQIGTPSTCSAEIACLQAGVIQVRLDLHERRLRGNLFEQNLLLKTVCGMMEEKGNGSSSGAQEHGLLSNLLDCPCLWLGLPMVGEVPEKQLCRKVAASAVSDTEQLLVSPFWGKFYFPFHLPSPSFETWQFRKRVC